MWHKQTSPLKLHDAYVLDPYPEYGGSDIQERMEQLLRRQENMLREMNLNLARSAEIQRTTQRLLAMLLGAVIVIGLLVIGMI